MSESFNLNSEFDQNVLNEWRRPRHKNTIFFFAFGITFTILNNEIDEIKVRYDDLPQCSANIGKNCTASFTLSKEIPQKIYYYYELNNYFQNHRVYLESKDIEQLQGAWKSLSQLENCGPNAKTNRDLDKTVAYDNVTPLQLDEAATPCGLIAKTMFNDTYELYYLHSNGTKERIPINENGISWPYDRERYKNTKYPKRQWINHSDEHFQVWMRAAGLSKFKKLWGRIERSLPQGNYEIIIANHFNTNYYPAKKFVVMTTLNAMGGKNPVLSGCYLAAGSISMILAITFLIFWFQEEKKKKH